MGRSGVGVGPARARPRRAIRPLRARRDQMASAGLDVWAYDHRGNGGSGGRRGHVDRWSQLHDDLQERLDAVRAAREGPRWSCTGTRGVDSSRRLPHAAGPPDAGSRRPDRARPGLDPAGLEEVARAGPWRCRADDGGLERRSIRRRCPGTRRWGSGLPRTRRTPRSTRLGSAPRRSPSRRGSAGVPADHGPDARLHGLDDGLVPAQASEILGHGPERRATDLPGAPPRTPQRAEGPAIIDEIIAWLRERATVKA